MDIFGFLDGLRVETIDRGWRRVPVLGHPVRSISGYVESFSGAPRRFLWRSGPSENDLGWGVVVNFALHVMSHAQRGLVFADSAGPVEPALAGNEEKNVLIALGADGLRRWVKGLGRGQRPLRAWLDNHFPVRWSRARSLTSDGASLGVVAIHNVAEPSVWAFHLSHNKAYLAPRALIVAMGQGEDVQAFASHMTDAFGEMRISIRRFERAEGPWAICVCQALA